MSCSVLLDNVCNVYQSPVNSNGRMTLRAALRSRPGTPEMREIRAVDGVSLRLREGDQLGIIGRNGAGKSTLLQLIAGLSEPTSGRVAIEGRVHAIMTLGTVLRDEVTGRDNIYLDGAVQSRTRVEIDRILDAVIEFSELGPMRGWRSVVRARRRRRLEGERCGCRRNFAALLTACRSPVIRAERRSMQARGCWSVRPDAAPP